MKLRFGVGSDSRARQILSDPLASPSRGLLRPSTASSTPPRTVYRAANTSSHSSDGCATRAMFGAMRVATQMTSAFTITRNRPIVDSSRRPVKATMTGRTKRWPRTRIAAVTRKGMIPAPFNWRMGADSSPNGNGCATSNRPRNRMMNRMTTPSTRVSTMKRRISTRPLPQELLGSA